jgi:hypothetical protein
MSPIGGFLPASQSLGKSARPFGEDDTSSAIQGVLQRIQSGQAHYDPASAAHAAVPPSIQATPQQRGGAFAPGPGDIGGGIEGGLPFSVKAGLGTGGFGQGGGAGTGGGTRPSSTGPAGSPTSSVVSGMLDRGGVAGGPAGGSAGPGPDVGVSIGKNPTSGWDVGQAHPSGYVSDVGAPSRAGPSSPLKELLDAIMGGREATAGPGREFVSGSGNKQSEGF